MARLFIWDGGDPGRASELGRVAIANVSPASDGFGLQYTADYLVVRVDADGAIRDGVVRDHLRASGVWPLMSLATDAELPADLPPGAVATLVEMSDRLQLIGPFDRPPR